MKKSLRNNLLYEHMISRQITIRDLAESTGISESTLLRFRNGESDLRMSTVLIIADYLQISLDDLFPRKIDNVSTIKNVYINSAEEGRDFFDYILSYRGKGNWRVIDEEIIIKDSLKNKIKETFKKIVIEVKKWQATEN